MWIKIKILKNILIDIISLPICKDAIYNADAVGAFVFLKQRCSAFVSLLYNVYLGQMPF